MQTSRIYFSKCQIEKEKTFFEKMPFLAIAVFQPFMAFSATYVLLLLLIGFCNQSIFAQQTDKETTVQQKKEPKKDMQNEIGFLEKYKAENAKLALLPVPENRVVLMGNSITEFWVNMSPAFFSENPFIGRGISGQTTPQMLLRFRQDVLDLHPKTVVISAGINDIAENTGPYNQALTLGNIASMAELAKANKIKVILASVHPASDFSWRKEIKDVAQKIIDLNKEIKAYSDKNGLTYLDYHTAMKNDINGMNPDLAEDGVHPTLKGYKIMEKLLLEAVKRTKKQKK
jgi:lysophospholipase L1-like esterase